MGYQELAPHPALRAYVDRFWVSSAGSEAAPRRILPDGCIDLIVHLVGGRGAVAVGAMTKAIVYHPRAPVRTVAVRFRPGGALPFLAVAADELTDRTVTCAELGLRWLEPARLEDVADLGGAARLLERSLLRRLHAVRLPDPLVAHAVSTLFGSTSPSIEDLSRRVGWTRQHLRRTFRHHVGLGPKQLARVARLQRTVDVLQRSPAAGLADAAVFLGYSDQAHMCRDLRELAGVTPRVAQASAGSIFPIRSLFAGA